MSEWEDRALGEVASITREVVHPSEVDAETAYVGLENVVRGGALVNVRSAGEAGLASAKFRFTDQHVLFGKLRPYLAKIARPDFAGVCSTDILPIMPSAGLDRGYLAHFLAKPDVIELANSRATGANLPRLSPAELLKFRLPLPRIEEQRRIAEVLDRADELRVKRREALAGLDDLTRSIFLDMFGDPATNPKSWLVVACSEVCRRVTVGIVFQPASYYQPAGEPALRSLNIRPGRISLENLVYFSAADNEGKLAKTRVWKDDVVLVRTGRPGTAAVVPDHLDGANAIDVLITTPNQAKVDSTYLCSYFNSPAAGSVVLGHKRGQIQQHLNVTSLKGVPVPLPPLELQHEFSGRVRCVEQLRESRQASLAELDALFASLQNRAFRGVALM